MHNAPSVDIAMAGMSVDYPPENTNTGNILDFLIPIGILIGVTVATQDMMQAIILALASCMILYLPRKKMTFTRYVELFFAGFADILPVLAILLASFMIKTACGEMGLSEYVINLCVPYMNAKTLAAIIFVVIAVLTFVTSSFWGIEAVAVSIVVPLAIALDANVLLALGAVVSGGVFGSHACFYSDATVTFLRDLRDRQYVTCRVAVSLRPDQCCSRHSRILNLRNFCSLKNTLLKLKKYFDDRIFPDSSKAFFVFLFFYTQSHQRTLQLGFGNTVFFVCQTAVCQRLLGPVFGSLGALCINILFPLPGCCQDTADPVHHGKHSADAGGISSRSVLQHNMRLAHTKCSAVIAVPRQNCQVAADGSADNARYVTLIEKSVRRADT